MDSSLETTLGSLKLERPTVLASGILGISLDVFKRLHDAGAGAVVTKNVKKNEIVAGNPAKYLKQNKHIVNLSYFR